MLKPWDAKSAMQNADKTPVGEPATSKAAAKITGAVTGTVSAQVASMVAVAEQDCLAQQWAELRRDIDQALARVDAGSVGYCNICGDRITEGHLAAHPGTSFCAACAG
ncbi:TraR/DksA family transcriptional regulator [Phaeobacter italicus]|uniref:TraR/DksA family transcriptional regulator n=1 Tax=Phaeobacter italicus TaxID=481446 RepID=UPI0006832670|nr:TraR/DksA C4-type zinc finger protein [Phaeobacter italicus]